uniref:Uncharacterized protein n=1 Tax=Promethearchaeum syntrophicum TaxID=2594042 RepID=A0A5B9DEQ5_9ARCH|nr:hypothetical protein [Candidatus Prometheoarchaeum syntrophicum]QEE17738.1 hypothetical protein DSAG12_03576 [Candidatus Prometheoarchaeum syntrophicum]
MEAYLPMIKRLSIEVEKGKFTHYAFDDSNVYLFRDLPIEAQIEILNTVLILYNLHLIPEDVFQKKYLDLVEEFSVFLHMAGDLAGIKPKNNPK